MFRSVNRNEKSKDLRFLYPVIGKECPSLERAREAVEHGRLRDKFLRYGDGLHECTFSLAVMG